MSDLKISRFFFICLSLIVMGLFFFLTNLSAEEDKSKENVFWYSKLFSYSGGVYKREYINGFKLPDFSYAGYSKGEKPIPKVKSIKIIEPLQGDNTKHIQKALTTSIGGALLLKEGIYNINDEIHIPSNTVLRGEGTDKTYIIVNNFDTKLFSAIVGNRSRIKGKKINSWREHEGIIVSIVGSVHKDSSIIIVKNTKELSIGDWIVIKNHVTDEFRIQYNDKSKINDRKIWPGDLSSVKFLRRIKSITGNYIEIDQPIPLELTGRDKPYVLKISAIAENIGLESLSIGFKTPDDFNIFNKLKSNGASAKYHAVDTIYFGNVVNGWIFDIKTFSPSNNGYHILSRGIEIANSRHITIKNCDIGYPVNIGNGGNGYGFMITMSNDCLISNCIARNTRHNFIFHFPSSGNVISQCKSLFSLFPNDFHHSLANTNLIENMKIYCYPGNKYHQAFVLKNRVIGSMGAGVTGVNNVFWRIKIIPHNFFIHSQQATAAGGRGYIIGATAVQGSEYTKGTEWREGINLEDSLLPISLYKTQLRNRLICESKMH